MAEAAQADVQAAKQEEMMERMMEQQAAMKTELKAQQDREEEFGKLGSNTDFAAAGAAGKKRSTCALQ